MQESNSEAKLYEIRLQGHLHGNWRDWFGEMSLHPLANGELVLAGPVADQAALFGLLAAIRDLGLTLIAINPVPPEPSSQTPRNNV